MANELVQGLLQDLLQPRKGPSPADIMAVISSQNPMAAVAAMQAPQLAQMFGQQFRGLIGGLRGQPAPLTADEAMAAATQQIAAQPDLMNSSAGLNQLAKAASTVGRTAEAMQFSLMASQRKAEEDAKAQAVAQEQAAADQRTISREGLSNLVVGSTTLTNQQKEALSAVALTGGFDGKTADLMKMAYPEEDGRFLVVGNHVWDKQTGTWAVGAGPNDVTQGAVAGAAEDGLKNALPGFDADQYDPTSVGRATTAYNSANTDADRSAALGLLKPKAATGEVWKTVNGQEVLWPETGTPRREANRTIASANSGRRAALNNATNFINIADGLLTDIAEGKTSAGASTAFLGWVPGTKYWDQRVDVETLKANLGIDALFAAREASVDGSSGFGQLTTVELQRLEGRVQSLSLAQTQEAFTEALTKLREDYAAIVAKDGGEMTLEDYVGLPRSTSVTTDSGNTFTIRERR